LRDIFQAENRFKNVGERQAKAAEDRRRDRRHEDMPKQLLSGEVHARAYLQQYRIDILKGALGVDNDRDQTEDRRPKIGAIRRSVKEI